ncbi:MAG: hypothetical protein ACRDRW_08070 [Pseudonocardiaceae bacterium]
MTSAAQPPPVPQPRLDRTVPDCPYVGLVPFDESDAPYFFGRQRECEVVVANLTASRLTLLYAASGVGKSSVLRAGVLPQFLRIARESYEDLGVPDTAVAYVSEWSLAPLDTIAAAVLRAVSRVPGAAPVEVPGPPRLGVPWLREVLRHSGVAAVYLVLDQFEEYFLYHPDDHGEDGLAGELGRILSTHDLPVNVLLSIREDALATLDRFKGRVPRLYDNYLRLAHLGRDAAQAAIEGPLDHYNQVVPQDSAMAVEPELTVTLLDQVRSGHLVVAPEGMASGPAADGREDIETPYLQLVLIRLWEAERASRSAVLRRGTLDELGGAQTIVQTHLHTVMAGLPPEQIEVAAEVFHYLVTTSGSKIALTAQDLADLSGEPVSSVRELLRSLSVGRRSILRPVPPPAGVAGPPRYEIFHDVMGAAVLDWRRDYVARRAQAEASRTLLAEREKAAAEREKAQAEAQATRRRLRQTRLLAAGLAVVLLIAGVLSVRSYYDKRDLREQRFLSAAAEYRDENPAESLRNAVKAYRINVDEDTREAVLTAASTPHGDMIAGFPGKPRVAGMVVTQDKQHVVTYDAQGGIRVIGEDGQTTKVAKVSHLPGAVDRAAVCPSASHVALTDDQGHAAVSTVGTGAQVGLATDGSPVTDIWCLDSSPDNLVLVRTSSGLAATYSATTGQRVARLPGAVSAAKPTADGQIVTSDSDSRLRVWNARTAEKVAESSRLAGQIRALQPYGHEAVGVTDDRNLIRWNWRASPEPSKYPIKMINRLSIVTVSEDTHTVAIVTNKAVTTYSLDNGSLQGSVPKQPSWLADMMLDPGGRWIATAGNDGRVRVWPTKNNGTPSRATYEFIANPSGVRRVNYLRDGKVLVYLGRDGTVWRCPIPQIPRFDLGDWVLSLDMSVDGRWLAAASADGKVHIVDPAGTSNVPVATVPVSSPVRYVKFDPTDPRRIVTLARSEKQPKWWRWDGGQGAEWLPEFETPPHPFGSLAGLDISRDGKRVAAGDDRGNIYLWDAHTGKLNDTIIGDHALINSGSAPSGIAFDPSGKMLAVTSPNGVLLTKLDAKERPTLLPLPDATWVAFDPGGKHIVGAARNSGILRVWTRDGQLAPDHELHARGGTVGRPSFSGDGRLVAAGTGEGLVEVWDVGSGRRVTLARQHSDLVNDVLFLPGGQSRLASASDDSTVAVFSCEACDDRDAVIRDAERWAGSVN